MRQQLDQLKSIRHAKIIQLYGGKSEQPTDAVLAKSTLRYSDMASTSRAEKMSQVMRMVSDQVKPISCRILSQQPQPVL